MRSNHVVKSSELKEILNDESSEVVPVEGDIQPTLDITNGRMSEI